MDTLLRLYLFALEVAPLEVGKTYNPLPSHLTLVSRFHSHKSPERISKKVSDLFSRTKSIELLFDQSATIGPRHTAVHLIKPRKTLKELHIQLLELLDEIDVDYTQPEYIRDGWKPHISKRDNDNFGPGFIHLAKAVYLIEVHKAGENDLRIIQKRFNLSSRPEGDFL